MKHHVILRVVAKLLIPAILLYAFYVQFHGDYSPGGGFQAGVIFAAAIILYSLIFGVDNAQKVMPPSVIVVFVGVGVASMLLGHNFLDYSPLGPDPKHGQHYGILAIEFGVGVTVASVMILVFYCFAGRSRVRADEEAGIEREGDL